MRLRISFVGIGIVVLFLLSCWFGWEGFCTYGNKDFGPNFAAAIVGGALGAAIALVVVLISFALQNWSRSKALEPARYLFLRQEGEGLKEAFIRYVDTLRIGQQSSVILAGKSWKALKREFWPDIDTISTIQSSIDKSQVSGQYENQALTCTYNQLRTSLEEVVSKSATAIFEGKESLIVPVLWEADFKVGSLWAKLSGIGAGRVEQQSLELTSVEKQIKEAGIAVGELLKALCKLGKGIQLKQ